MNFMPTTLSVSPWANPEVLIAIITAISAVIVAAVSREWRKAKKATPISAKEHEQQDDAERFQEYANQIIVYWQGVASDMEKRHKAEVTARDCEYGERFEAFRRELRAERERGDRLEREVSELRRESVNQSRVIYSLRSALSRAQEWLADLERNWSEYRQRTHPPSIPKLTID